MQLEGSAVEVDEMYFGGKRKGRNRKADARGDKVKTNQCSEWLSVKGCVSSLSAVPDTTAKTLVGTRP